MLHEFGFFQALILAALLFVLYRVRKALPGSALGAWHDQHRSPGALRRWHRILLLELIELGLAGVFLLVGGAKLTGRPDMVALFRDIGVGQWFRYVTGTIEVTGAALLIVPRLTGGSAMLLGVVMIAATLIEFFVLHRPPVAALACLSGHAFVAWSRVSRRHRAATPGIIRPAHRSSVGEPRSSHHHQTRRYGNEPTQRPRQRPV
jgi:putative oxidoreductase